MVSAIKLLRQAADETGKVEREFLVEYVTKQILADPTLLQEILPALIREKVQGLYGATRMSGKQRISLPSRWSAAATEYKSYLARMEYVAGEWKFLGDCTLMDLNILAADRRADADELLAKADQYAAIAEAMEEQNALTVEELGEDFLEKVFDPIDESVVEFDNENSDA